MFGDKKFRTYLLIIGFFSVIITISNFLAIKMVHVSDFVTIGNSSIVM